MRRRFERLAPRTDRATFVAVEGTDRVIGWVHVAEQCTIEADAAGEVWASWWTRRRAIGASGAS